MIFNTHLKISKSNSKQLFQEFGEEGMFPNSFNEVSITLALKSERHCKNRNNISISLTYSDAKSVIRNWNKSNPPICIVSTLISFFPEQIVLEQLDIHGQVKLTTLQIINYNGS